jgi:hypothetical protein
MYKLSTDFIFPNITLNLVEYNPDYNILHIGISHLKTKEIIIDTIYNVENEDVIHMSINLYSPVKYTKLGKLNITFYISEILKINKLFKNFKLKDIFSFKIYLSQKDTNTKIILIPKLLFNKETYHGNELLYRKVTDLIDVITNNIKENNFNKSLRFTVYNQIKQKKVLMLDVLLDTNNNFAVLGGKSEYIEKFKNTIEIFKGNVDFPRITLFHTYIDYLKYKDPTKYNLNYTILSPNKLDLSYKPTFIPIPNT